MSPPGHSVRFLMDFTIKNYGIFSKVCMARSIQKIGNKCLETREQCIEILTSQLENYAQSDPILNCSFDKLPCKSQGN